MLKENQLENKNSATPKSFEFSRVIKAKHRSAFAQYLTGFADILSKTKNKTLSLKINLNGGLEFVISSPNSQDLKDIELDLMQYLLNISLVSRGQNPILEIDPEADKNQSQKALIAIKSSIRNLETQMELQDPKMTLDDFKNRVFDEYLQEIKTAVLHLSNSTESLVSSQIFLLEENKKLKELLKNLKNELKKIQNEQNLETSLNQNLDVLVGLIGQVSLALQEEDEKERNVLIKKVKREIKEISEKYKTQWKLLVVPVKILKDSKSVYDLLVWLIDLLQNFKK